MDNQEELQPSDIAFMDEDVTVPEENEIEDDNGLNSLATNSEDEAEDDLATLEEEAPDMPTDE